ncbi:PREDICTED: LOW QUALITY PROTEIN: E3 ubiquitin-protein ligase makorin-1-like [Chinchilla lanigera]|uniref:LOW QUALITY PROTEIN: E3 ubiquitin-protein ligase makorin-1-like n=1 Tax=Chinchilla lanigera TaxID=34839 RepID=UPI000695CADF|nr:PREDICTED: LOW QUALITY PROTEIN: E3 ubiquitin-protein ligase makorin-1-like [Chinchilla lanigera]
MDPLSSSGSDSDSEAGKRLKRKKQVTPEQPRKKRKAGETSRALSSPERSSSSSSENTLVPSGAARCRMHGASREGDNCCYSHDLSDSPCRVVCKCSQPGDRVCGEHCRYEHSKPLKEEEAAATDLPVQPSLAAASSLSSVAGPHEEMNTGKDASRNVSFPAIGPGSKDWVNAMEFVPGQPYRGRIIPARTEAAVQGSVPKAESETKKQVCPYAAMGECRDGANCVYLHGDACDMCGLPVLHPTDTAQRSQHIKSCIEAHEKDMELSFAVQRSKDMMCDICMEVVYEKAKPSERRFGILSNCNHTYCLRCIREWRSAKQFDSKIIKSCPECRITSNFVIPSEYWVEEKEEKQKLIQKYKEAMSNKACRYFDEGRGSCPFGRNCFYKHAYPDELDGRRAGPQRQAVPVSRRSWAGTPS